MTIRVIVEALPALRGDCLWIECLRPGLPPWRLLIDGGLPECWPVVRERIARAATTQRPVHIDLVVVSHIDADHIGGLLPLLAARDLPVTVGDVWFNGLPQLPTQGISRSVAQGDSLVALLSGSGVGATLPWNERFGRAAVMTPADAPYLALSWPDGPVLTLLSPTARRLEALRDVWSAEHDRLKRGEAAEPPRAAIPLPLDDLDTLARTKTVADRSAANGSSIAFLLEHGGVRCLLGADAFSSVLGTALTALANARDGQPIALDLFKLPHHGSASNVTLDLLRVAPAQRYLVSTNGDRFGHPDDIALARVATALGGPRDPIELWFNYASETAQRWSDPVLQAKHGFVVQCPDKRGPAGARIELPGRDA